MADYFTDRVVEHPGRVQLISVSGETDIYDMIRAEGTVAEAGTPFNAETFNAVAQDILDHVPDIAGHAVFFGECDTEAGTSLKTVTVDSDFVLEAGAIVAVKFTNENANSGSTSLKVNDTAAKTIKAITASKITGYWRAGGICLFVYDGTNWVIPGVRSAPIRITGTLGSAPSSGQCAGWYDPATRAVRLTWGFAATANVGLDDTLFTIPSAYRPASDVSAVCIVGTAAGTIGAGGSRITSGGIVQQRITSQARSGFGYLEYILE